MAEEQFLTTPQDADDDDGAQLVLTSGTPVLRSYDTSDKLTIINQALINTGNNTCDTIEDGSDEWKVASSAFEQWSQLLLYGHDWKFAARFANLTRVGASAFPGFSDVFDKPQDCLYLQNVYRTDLASLVIPYLGFAMPDEDTRPPDLEYRVLNDQIHCVGPCGVTAIYMPFPIGAQPWSVGFMSALRTFMESTVLRGLNEDNSAADRREAMAQRIFDQAKSRSDGEEPRRTMFRSSILERRRKRGNGWWP